MSELAKALAKVQANLPAVHKGAVGSITGKQKYRYADLADITSAVIPVLAAQGLSWLTMPTYDADGRFVLRYELLHISGESRTGDYPLPSSTAKPQEIGSAITYGRRYTLCSVVGVVADEDDDGAAAQNAAPPARRRDQPASSASPADNARAELRTECEAQGWDLSQVAKVFEQQNRVPLKSCQDAALIGSFAQALIADAEHVLGAA